MKKTNAKVASPQPSNSSQPVTEASPAKPLVFISHDTRDAALAEAFADLLQDASGGILRSFRSSDRKGTSGIEFGAEWYSAIMEKLNDATDVVALLTPQSLGRPWLLYEAGVAKGKLDGTVFGIALGVPLEDAGVGPFAQFQNCGDDEDSLTKLLLQLIRRNPDANPREEAVRRQVVAFKAASSSLQYVRPESSNTTSPTLDASAVAKLFEEVKIMFRQLPDQLEMSLERRLRRVSSIERHRSEINSQHLRHLLDDLTTSTPGDEGTAWMSLSALAQDYWPSLYEPARKMSEVWRLGNPEKIGEARELLLAQLRTGPPITRLTSTKEGWAMRQLHGILDHTLNVAFNLDPVIPKPPTEGKSS
jgi:hypothetical protein